MTNIEFVKLLNNILKNIKISDEEIDKILIENSEDKISFKDKITKTLEKNILMIQPQHIARIIGKYCKRESIKNVKKRREIWRKYNLKKFIKRRSTKEITQ